MPPDVVDRLRDRYAAAAYKGRDDRDVPILDLLTDADPRFQPCQGLLETIDAHDVLPTTLRYVYSLDRPVVPILNALYAAGLVTGTSCAGHTDADTPSPHLSVNGNDARTAAALERLAERLPFPLLVHSLHLWKTDPRQMYERTSMWWGFPEQEDPRNGYPAVTLRELDLAALEAADGLTTADLPGHIETPQSVLLKDIGALLEQDKGTFPTRGGAAWVGQPELRDGDVLGVMLYDARRKAQWPAAEDAGWRLEVDLERRTPEGPTLWTTLWTWRLRAETLADLDRMARAALSGSRAGSARS